MKRMMFPDPLQWTHVYNPTDEAALRASGWVDDVPQDIATAVEVTNADPSARDLLQAQADAIGLKVDGRWSDATLAEEIAKAS